MKKLFILRLLFDFGLVVLIWIVQLIIYPGFQFYAGANLEVWHPVYTTAIASIVIPLMLGQLITVALQLREVKNVYTLSSIGFVVLVWLLTFLIFVPIHNELGMGKIVQSRLKDLVNLNWFRTGLWTTIFLLNVMVLKTTIGKNNFF